jgi:protein-disulfide isomerase
MYRISILFLFGLLAWAASSCSPGKDSETLAEIAGTVVTRVDVDKSGGKQLRALRQQLYQLERQKLDEHIGAILVTLEAKKRRISVATLLEQEVNSSVKPPSEEEIRGLYEKNKARIPVELEKVRDQIRNYLHEQKITERKIEYFKTLRINGKVTTYLKPPELVRVDLSVNGAPSKGSEKAEVTIVKFEDFQCPYCKAVQPNYQEVLKRYDGKVRLVHKDLPLDQIHPQARQAAEAARCADDEGKFWQYHDKLYASAPKAAPEDLKSYAKEVGLNGNSFEKCLSTGKYKARVQKDVDEGAALGLTGTPIFFINGRELSGAQSVEAIAQIIDEELARTN